MVGVRRCVVAAALAVGLSSGSAHAQDRSAAAALFEKGLASMKEKDFAHGCPALAASYKIDPLPGTLFTLSECQASAGKLASALVGYGDFLALVQSMSPPEQHRQQARVDRTKAQVDDLTKRVPKLTITLPANAPAGTTVTRDGEPVPSAILGVAVGVDIGEHVFATTPPGGAPHETRVTLAAGEKKTIELPVDDAIAKTTAAAPPPTPPPTTGPATDDHPPAKRSVLPYVALGVGVVGLGVGSVFGLQAISKKKTVDANCTGSLCNQAGITASKSMKTDGTISTVGFGVGLAAVAAGVVLLVVGGHGDAASGHAVTPILNASAQSGFIGAAGTF